MYKQILLSIYKTQKCQKVAGAIFFQIGNRQLAIGSLLFFIMHCFRRQNYNRFPKHLIPHNRNMFPHRAKYDEVVETGGVNVSYIVVC